MTRTLLMIVGLAMSGLRTPAFAQEGPPAGKADSIVLERSPCFGTCPAYRLSLRQSGVVTFQSMNRGDGDRTARDSVAPGSLTSLIAEADRSGVFLLPTVITRGRALCPDFATDHETVVVTFFWPGRVHRISDYHGCFLTSEHVTAAPLESLRRFEAAIDSVADSRRWVRPNRMR